MISVGKINRLYLIQCFRVKNKSSPVHQNHRRQSTLLSWRRPHRSLDPGVRSRDTKNGDLLCSKLFAQLEEKSSVGVAMKCCAPKNKSR